jgi:hypothetical protein
MFAFAKVLMTSAAKINFIIIFLFAQITQLIRHNQALEKDLDAMDIKIGLLIKNRIDLDEVMAHNRLLLSRKQSHKDFAHSAANGLAHEGNWPGNRIFKIQTNIPLCNKT